MEISEIKNVDDVKTFLEKINTEIDSIVESFNNSITERDTVINKLENEVEELKRQIKKRKIKDPEITTIVSDTNHSVITVSTRREGGGEITMSKKVIIMQNETEDQAYMRTYFDLLQCLGKTV